MSVISYLLLISPLKIVHCFHRLLNSHSLGMSLVLTNAFIYCAMGIINLMSSATIFTSAHIAILPLSLYFFTRAHITSLLLLLFSGTPYYWFPYCINFYVWSTKEIFLAEHMCWFFKFTNFPMAFLVYDLNLTPHRAMISLLSPYVVSYAWFISRDWQIQEKEEENNTPVWD